MPFNRDEPFNNLPDLPPRLEIETGPVLKEAIKANRLLAELKGFCMTLPDPKILINTVMLQESKDSSAIENIITTQDDLYRAIALPEEASTAPPEVKEVLRYREAIYEGHAEMKRTGAITTNVMVRIMQALKRTDDGVRRLPGTKLAKPASGEIIYTPPVGETLLREKLQALESFLNQEQPPFDPLIMMALMHYQFEAIHPFSDGNGRTGRILNVLYLVHQELLTLPVLYLSGHIINRKREYYRCLREVTEHGAWKAWIIYMLKAVAETSHLTLSKIRRMNLLREETLDKAKEAIGSGPARELVDLMFSHPYIKIATLEAQGLARRQAASKYLHSLVAVGLLQPVKFGRDKYFINARLMQVLTDEG